MTQHLRWRKSSFSPGSNCVEMAVAGDAVAVRNSNHPDADTLQLSRPQVGALIAAALAGDLNPNA
jgi:hypothetical protein